LPAPNPTWGFTLVQVAEQKGTRVGPVRWGINDEAVDPSSSKMREKGCPRESGEGGSFEGYEIEQKRKERDG